MIRLRKAFVFFQVHLTAIMILAAGMPQWVCACTSARDRISIPEAGPISAECCCCGTCASMAGENKASDVPGSKSCCNSGQSRNPEALSNSKESQSQNCQRAIAPPKIPGVPPSNPSKAVTVSWVPFTPPLVTPLQSSLPISFDQWSGHSPAPPGDLVTSLQRLLI